jgi:MFS family permease
MDTLMATTLERDGDSDGHEAYAERWGSIVLVLSTAACIGITLGLFPSLIALNVEGRGFDTSWNGLLAAMPAVAGILVGPFVPRAIAVLGALRTFLLSSALAIAAACLFTVSSDLVSWFLIRFAMGVGMGIQWVVSETWVNRLATGPRRGTVLSVYVIVLSAAIAAGPFLLSRLGTQGPVPFLATAALLVVSCLPLFFAKGAVAEGAGKTPTLPFLQAVRRKPSAMLTGLIDGFVFQTLLVFIPVYFMRLGSPESSALYFLALFCIGAVILQFLIGYMLDRWRPAVVLMICCSLVIVGLGLMSEVWRTSLLAWPVVLVMGGAAAAIYTAGLAGINDAFSGDEMPSGTAAFSVLWYVGGLSGPVVAGYAMDLWNPYGMAAAVAVACAILVGASTIAARVYRLPLQQVSDS